MKIDRLVIENYKSIKKVDLELNNLNVFIGANGAGKSNFISLFKMLNAVVNEKLQSWVAQNVGAENILHFGLKKSKHLSVKIWFDRNGYYLNLQPKKDGSLYFEQEKFMFKTSNGKEYIESDNSGHDESKITLHENSDVKKHIEYAIKSWKIYHFHDTSDNAAVKQPVSIYDNRELEENAGNIAAFLYKLKIGEPNYLKRIEKYIQLVLPYFHKFILEPDAINPKMIKLSWQHKDSEKIFEVYHLSDGMLRFICLATLLNQPKMPEVIIIDEPELGLHPYAITILSDMINKAKEKTQILLATQSVELINHLSLEDLIIVDNKDKQSVFHRFSEDEFKEWLQDYSLGELWQKNLLGGRP